jgi:26S proteasome regulatory subunit N7
MASICQLKASGALLLNALSTFTAIELTMYDGFVALTIIINALTLKQVDLKKWVCSFSWGLPLLTLSPELITAPEVISVLPEILIIGDILNNLYDCHYAKFFVALGAFLHTYNPLPKFLSSLIILV